jgi:hypothetical protein
MPAVRSKLMQCTNTGEPAIARRTLWARGDYHGIYYCSLHQQYKYYSFIAGMESYTKTSYRGTMFDGVFPILMHTYLMVLLIS